MFWTDWFFKEKDRYKNGAPASLSRDGISNNNNNNNNYDRDDIDEEDPHLPTKTQSSSSPRRSDLAFRKELTNIVCSVQQAKNRIADMRIENGEAMRRTFQERFTPRPGKNDSMDSSRTSSFRPESGKPISNNNSFRSPKPKRVRINTEMPAIQGKNISQPPPPPPPREHFVNDSDVAEFSAPVNVPQTLPPVPGHRKRNRNGSWQ